MVQVKMFHLNFTRGIFSPENSGSKQPLCCYLVNSNFSWHDADGMPALLLKSYQFAYDRLKGRMERVYKAFSYTQHALTFVLSSFPLWNWLGLFLCTYLSGSLHWFGLCLVHIFFLFAAWPCMSYFTAHFLDRFFHLFW